MIYLSSVVNLNSTISMRLLSSPGTLTFIIWFQIWRIIQFKTKTGRFFNKEMTLLFDATTGKFEKLRLLAILIDSVFQLFNFALVMATLKFAFYAEINQGVITCIFASQSLFVALLTYFFQNERLNIYQILGMMLMLLCVLTMGLSDRIVSQTTYVPPSERISIAIPIMIAIGTTLVFASRLYLARYFSRRFNV